MHGNNADGQVEFSLARRHPDTSGLLETCRSLDMHVFGYSTLACGRLTGKYNKNNPAPMGRRFGNQPCVRTLASPTPLTRYDRATRPLLFRVSSRTYLMSVCSAMHVIACTSNQISRARPTGGPDQEHGEQDVSFGSRGLR